MRPDNALARALPSIWGFARVAVLCRPDLCLTYSPLSLICRAWRQRSHREPLEQGCVTDIRRMAETPALFFKRSTARLPHHAGGRQEPGRPVSQHIGMTNLASGLIFSARKIPTLTHFTDFGLASPILKALATEGYETPTPIQAQAIPLVLAGRDLWASPRPAPARRRPSPCPSSTASTPTSAPAPRNGLPRASCSSPTRELASQIAESFRTYGRHMRLTTAVVFGGVAIGKQERDLAHGVDVLVATPGRLLDLIDRRAVEPVATSRSSSSTRPTRCSTSASSMPSASGS